MKKTIITLASVAALAGAAKAQTNFDFSGWNHATVSSIAGQDFDIFGDGSILANVKATGQFNHPSITSSANSAGNVFLGNLAMESNTISISFSAPVGNINIGYGFLGSNEVATLSPNNWDALHTSGAATIESPSNIFSGSGVGTDPVTGAATGSLTASGNFNTLTLTYSNNGTLSGASSIQNFQFSGEAVPEPSSTALLGLGALGLLVRRKR